MTADPLFSVADQVVLVSGGSRGIGRALAAGFCQRGAQVVITGRHADVLGATAQQIGADAAAPHTEVCDVADPDAVKDLTQRVLKQYGHVDTLINVAGVNRRKPAETVTLDDYEFVMNVNLRGAFLLSQRIGAAMLERGRGSQINIASLNTDRPLKHVAPYAISKAGMGQMTRALALEWGGEGCVSTRSVRGSF